MRFKWLFVLLILIFLACLAGFDNVLNILVYAWPIYGVSGKSSGSLDTHMTCVQLSQNICTEWLGYYYLSSFEDDAVDDA